MIGVSKNLQTLTPCDLLKPKRNCFSGAIFRQLLVGIGATPITISTWFNFTCNLKHISNSFTRIANECARHTIAGFGGGKKTFAISHWIYVRIEYRRNFISGEPISSAISNRWNPRFKNKIASKCKSHSSELILYPLLHFRLMNFRVGWHSRIGRNGNAVSVQ